MAAEVVGPQTLTDALLSSAVQARADAARAEARMLTDLARWAVRRSRECDVPVAPLPGQERRVRLGGSGTPLIGEFVPAEAAARVGLSAVAAGTLVADALTLVHRMPRLLEVLASGQAQAWRVRMAAAAGRGLSRASCLRLEEYLVTPYREGAAPPVVTLTRATLSRLLEQYTITHDETDDHDAGDAATADALAGRYVSIRHGLDGTSDLSARLSTADAMRLDAAIDQIAADAADEGDQQPRAVRHAVALGRMADLATGSSGAGSAVRPVTVFVHLDAATGTFCTDGAGPVTQAAAAEILADSTAVTLAPVIDLASDLTYTGYVAPARLRTQLALIQHETCCFPWCDRPVWLHPNTRTADYDHRTPYADGGATSTANGQLLCRFHHRIKTHSAWRARRDGPGRTHWISSDGSTYLVEAGHTTPLRT